MLLCDRILEAPYRSDEFCRNSEAGYNKVSYMQMESNMNRKMMQLDGNIPMFREQ